MQRFKFQQDRFGRLLPGYSKRDHARRWPSLYVTRTIVLNPNSRYWYITEDEALARLTHPTGRYKVIYASTAREFIPYWVPDEQQMVIQGDGPDHYVVRQAGEVILRTPEATTALEFVFQKLRTPYSLDNADGGVPPSYAIQLQSMNDAQLRREYKWDLAHGSYHQREIKIEMDERGHVARGGKRERLMRINTAKRTKGGRGKRDR